MRSELSLCCFDIAKENVNRSGVFGVEKTLPASLAALESGTVEDRRLLEALLRNPDTVEVNDLLEANEGVRGPWKDADARRWCPDNTIVGM